MTYNQQNDAYAQQTRLNQPLPGTGTVNTEDSYETGRPTDGLMAATGLGHEHHHNQPMAGYGGGASNMKSQGPYDNANIGIAPVGTGLIHDLTGADVNARHRATEAIAAGELNAGHKTGVVDKIKAAVMPGHQAQAQHVASGGAYNTTVAPMATTGTHVGTTGLGNNMGTSTYIAGEQPMHGTHKTGMVDQVKDAIAGPTHNGATYNTDNTYANTAVSTGPTGTYIGAPLDTGMTTGHAYNSTTTDHVHDDHLHGQKKTGVMGMVEQVKEKVSGHGAAPHSHGHPMTSDGYKTDPAINTNQYSGNVNSDVYGHRTGTEGLTGVTHNTTTTTSPTNAYDTTGMDVHSQYPVTTPHPGTAGMHPVEEKPGGIKGLISKVTGH